MPSDAPLTAPTLSHIFSSINPTLLPASPPSPSAPSSPRQQRYIAVKLSRAILAFFDTAPPTTPKLRAEVARFVRDCASDKASGTALLDTPETMVGLGEVVLCAALYSDQREAVVQAVCTLSMDVQDLLAGAVHAVLDTDEEMDADEIVDEYSDCQEELEEEEEEKSVLENAASNPAAFSTAPPALITSNVLTENVSKRDAPCNTSNTLANENAQNQPHPQESALREKILFLEQRLREQKANADAAAAAIDAKTTAQGEARDAGDAGDGLRAALVQQQRAQREENAVRAGAGRREKEELQEEGVGSDEKARRTEAMFGDLRDARIRVGELEAENAALRDAETRGATQVRILESQLDASNARAETLVSLSEGLSRDLQVRETEVNAVRDENGKLAARLDEATVQITALLGAAADSESKGAVVDGQEVGGGEEKEGKQEDKKEEDRNGDMNEEKKVEVMVGCVNVEGDSVGDSVAAATVPTTGSAAALDRGAVSAALHAELGVAMPWDDIVECVRGVIDAMREMDEVDAAEQQHQAHDFGQEPSQPAAVPQHRLSSGMSASSGEGERRTLSGGVRRKIPTLQDFIEVDMHMEAAGSERDDDFDFAADQKNVTERGGPAVPGSDLPLSGALTSAAVQSTSSPSPRFDGLPVLPRRRSSAPSLPPIPEECETPSPGIKEQAEEAQSDSDGDLDDQSCSSVYSSPRDASKCPAEERNGDVPRQLVDATATPPRLQTIETTRQLPARTSPKRGTPEEGSPRASGHAPEVDGEVGSGTVVGIPYEGSAGAQPVGLPVPAPVGSDSAIGSLIQQLADSREELCLVQTYATAKERECSDIRKELSLLINEVDGLLAERDSREEHSSELVAEKERLVKHLQGALQSRTVELTESRAEVDLLRTETTKLGERFVDAEKLVCEERARLTDELFTVNKKLSEEVRMHEVDSRSQQVEIARLTAQVESAEVIARKIRACVSETGDLNEETSRERFSYYQELMQTLLSEKEAAERAREETRVLARKQTEKLAEIHDSAKAAAVGREYNVDLRVTKARKSTRGVSAFLRRVGKKEAGVFDTSLIMKPVPSTAVATNGFPSRPILPR